MATPNPRLHLLALPRELRDRIYGFLTHDLVLKDAGEYFGRTSGEIFVRYYPEPNNTYMHIVLTARVHTTITVENAPYMDVMLANSQIHREYRGFCILKLSASIRCDRTTDIIAGGTTNNSLFPNANTSAALTLVKNITLWLREDMHEYLRRNNTTPFLDALAGKLPSLQTLRLIIFNDGEDEDPPPDDMSLGNLLPRLSDSFPRMTRRQNVFGQKVWSDAHMAEFRALVYSSRQRSSELWTPESVMSYWSPEEERCARRLSLPLSVLGQAESMHGYKIRIDKWIDESCSD